MNVVREINKINEAELALGVTGSWHDEYKDSAYVFVGGLNTELTEGDVITIMSQFGEISNINLPRNKETGAPRGFAFIMYADQRSTILAVDNLNGASVLGRTLRVDHVKDYKQGRVKNDEGEWVDKDDEEMNALPQMPGEAAEESESEDESDDGIDPEDPMAGYLKAKRAEEKKKQKKKGKSKHEGETKEERRARKKAKKEKKAQKGKDKTEGVRAVEALLANFGRDERSPPAKRRREDFMDRDNSPARRPRGDSPPKRSRGDSARPNRDGSVPRYPRDQSPGPRRQRDDVSPPRRYRNDSPPSRRAEDPSFRRHNDVSPPRRYRNDRSPPRRPREESPDRPPRR